MSYFPHDGNTQRDGPGAGILFLNDAWAAWLLVNDARYRVLQRYLGVPRDQANTACLVAAMLVAEKVAGGAGRVHQATPRPHVADTAVGLTLASEVIFRLVGGISVRDAEVAGTLVLVVIVGKKLHSSGRSAVDETKAKARSVKSALTVRYGTR